MRVKKSRVKRLIYRKAAVSDRPKFLLGLIARLNKNYITAGMALIMQRSTRHE